MKTWSAFYHLVVPEVQGAPLPVIDSALRQVAIDFTTSSLVHQVALADIAITPGTASYTPTVPDGYSIALMLEAWIDNEQLSQTAASALATGYQNWRTEAGRVTSYLSETPDSILLYRIPDDTYTGKVIKCRAALTPVQSATGIEDWLFEAYAQQIADGAKAYLMRLPGPWANPTMLQYYSGAYASHKNGARTDGKRNFGRASMTVKLPRF